MIANRAGFRIPSLIPPPSSTVVPLNPSNSSGLVPANILQHSGYYFYLSGTCAVMRRERFRAVLKSLVGFCVFFIVCEIEADDKTVD